MQHNTIYTFLTHKIVYIVHGYIYIVKVQKHALERKYMTFSGEGRG